MHIQSLQWFTDLNTDGGITLGVLWEVIRGIFRLPGSVVVELIGHYPFIAKPLGIAASPETGYASLNGLLAKAISLAFWIPLLMSSLSFSSRTKQRLDFADEHPAMQPLLLPRPKNYQPFTRHS